MKDEGLRMNCMSVWMKDEDLRMNCMSVLDDRMEVYVALWMTG